jgi:hypothetical protein
MAGGATLRVRLTRSDGAVTEVAVPQRRAAGHGGVVWPGALALAAFAASAEGRRWVRGRRAVELGAGTGLPGVVAACAAGADVVLTDKPALVPVLEDAVRGGAAAAAAAGGGLTTAALEFGAALRRLPRPAAPPWDVVLASEVLGLSDTLYPPILKTLADADARAAGAARAAGGGVDVLLSHRPRDVAMEAAFFAAAADDGWDATLLKSFRPAPWPGADAVDGGGGDAVVDIAVDGDAVPCDEDAGGAPIQIWHLRRRRGWDRGRQRGGDGAAGAVVPAGGGPGRE